MYTAAHAAAALEARIDVASAEDDPLKALLALAEDVARADQGTHDPWSRYRRVLDARDVVRDGLVGGDAD